MLGRFVLLGARPARLPRPLPRPPAARCKHSASSSSPYVLRHRNLYRQLDYTAPFDEQERLTILSVLNRAETPQQLPGMAKKDAERVLEYKAEWGDFEAVEQMLDVQQFEENKLLRMGKKWIKSASSTANKADPKVNRTKAKLQKAVRPPFVQSAQNATSWVGIKFNALQFSYAHLDNSNRLLEWDSLAYLPDHLEANSAAGTGLEHHHLTDACLLAESHIPHASFYVFELNQPLASKANTFLQQKVNALQFQAGLTALLAQRHRNVKVCNGAFSDQIRARTQRTMIDLEKDEEGGDDNDKVKVPETPTIHSMSSAVLDSLFNLRVGQERVSVREQIRSLVQPVDCLLTGNPSPFWTDVSEDQWAKFHEVGHRDQLATALLVARAAGHLIKS